ncbi:phosphoenolpyruvate--protein phosphotransferase [Leifsonia sp. PS1209]|uniref:phosphoenolpyruvate--protein phosphotransferase n=1 Tax=Leifsonia sp. PS1209 TaxID=2724914 RepID=UPI001442DC2F|nr:phosphoenolpyruvate--protein phosphotransferase [Leifsonia sp. PS1209]QIZ97226.1 phosphoenolpyruvate--protein phosphotransferase [Leifsonia sp. PS1209]
MSDTTATDVLTGAGIGQGIAIGPVLRMSDPLPEPADTPSTSTPDEERARFASAVAAVADDLRARAAKVDGTAADVLEAQSMMAEDSTLASDVSDRIESGKTAERAVFEGFAVFRDMLIGLGGYMGERATDLDDVAQRVISALSGRPAPGVPQSDTPYILVAHDLAPADTALLDLTKVLGLVTREGGPTSHTAILAREKAIVAIVGVAGADAIADGTEIVVDAASGTVTVAPDAERRADAERRIADREAALSGGTEPGTLADGTAIPLLANLGSADGAQKAVDAGAEGVGLFRTEFLFLDQRMAPTVEQQRAEYIRLLSAFPGQKVVARVLDAGADKPLEFLNDAHEDNPALGLRGLRALRANEDLLREQLTALAEADAATDADLWVMAPMVATVEETRYFVQLASEFGLKTVGVMVEIPSAALTADRILREAAFASIGTNDLTQYSLAADRLLGSVAGFQDPWHPAVLRLIGEVGKAGSDLGKPVGICGEAAADPLLAVVLVGLGATTLSMSPAAIADVRMSIKRFTLDQAKNLAEIALAADGAAEARDAVRAAISGRPPQ